MGMTANATITNNVFFNGPRAGLNVNDGFGGGHDISRNVGFNFVRETEDHGVFNSCMCLVHVVRWAAVVPKRVTCASYAERPPAEIQYLLAPRSVSVDSGILFPICLPFLLSPLQGTATRTCGARNRQLWTRFLFAWIGISSSAIITPFSQSITTTEVMVSYIEPLPPFSSTFSWTKPKSAYVRPHSNSQDTCKLTTGFSGAAARLSWGASQCSRNACTASFSALCPHHRHRNPVLLPPCTHAQVS